MNGEEVVIKKRATKLPKLSLNAVKELSNPEKLDLIVYCTNPQIEILWKLMEMEIIQFRDDAMAVDPAKKDEQSARMTEAHAVAKFYERVRNSIQYITQEHLNQAKQLEYEQQMQSPEEILKVLLSQ